jgi:hypothetical protein
VKSFSSYQGLHKLDLRGYERAEERKMYIEPILAEMQVLSVPSTRKVLPCTEGEVHALEQKCHCSLPRAYKEFLLTMGKGAGNFFVGSDLFYPDLDGMQEVAVEILTEVGFPQKLPEDAFVFFMHQGYLFNFFLTSDGDDPPIYRYLEGTDRETFPLIYNHFTDFLLDEIQTQARGLTPK